MTIPKLSDRVARPSWSDLACATLLVLLGGLFVWELLWQRAQRGEGVPSYDIYAYFYPNVLYALRALQDGHGLLWNSVQNCGQPFFANPQTALLYPPNWIFLLLDVDAGLLALTVLHLSIGGIGTYALCRELQLRRLPALAGAIAFELGGITIEMAVWMPNISGAFVWMPVAVLALERLLRIRSFAAASLLGLILAVQLFAGYPQISYFTYQILAVRTAWAVAFRQCDWRTAVLVVTGLSLAPLLAAVHLIPGAEFAGMSVRSATLTVAETNVMAATWEHFRYLTGIRITGPGTILTVVASALAGAALLRSRRPRVSFCYALLALLFFTLSFDNFLSQIYRPLPIASIFRGPDRFLWPADFCFSVLVAFGLDAVRLSAAGGPWNPVRVIAGALLGGAGYYWIAVGGLRVWEWGLAALLIVTLLVMATRVGRRSPATGEVVILAILVAGLMGVARHPVLGALKDAPAQLTRHREAFSLMRERVGNEGRVVVLGDNEDYSFMRKSPSVFAVPGIGDYEPMTSRRYAEFYVKMVEGAAQNVWMENINQFYFVSNQIPTNRPLLNLTATRFLAVDEKLVRSAKAVPFPLVQQLGPVRIYENPAALPRAFFVPQVAVATGLRDLLNELSSKTFPVRSLALLGEPPPDGYYGSAGSMGSAQILSDRSEELTLRAYSDAGGFVFVSDQYYPGWEATVNDVPATVLNANFAFRLVRIPPGESTVVFRYRPASLRMGATITLVTVLAICAGLLFGAFRRLRRLPSVSLTLPS